MSIAKAFTHITTESVNGVSTVKSSAKALDATANANTDIMITQPANTVITSATLVNTGEIKTAGAAGDDLDLSIGHNPVGDASNYINISDAKALLDDNAAAVVWGANARLQIISPLGSTRKAVNAFAPEPLTTEASVFGPSDLLSIPAARELNFRFTPLLHDLATTSTVQVICEFQAL